MIEKGIEQKEKKGLAILLVAATASHGICAVLAHMRVHHAVMVGRVHHRAAHH